MSSPITVAGLTVMPVELKRSFLSFPDFWPDEQNLEVPYTVIHGSKP